LVVSSGSFTSLRTSSKLSFCRSHAVTLSAVCLSNAQSSPLNRISTELPSAL